MGPAAREDTRWAMQSIGLYNGKDLSLLYVVISRSSRWLLKSDDYNSATIASTNDRYSIIDMLQKAILNKNNCGDLV